MLPNEELYRRIRTGHCHILCRLGNASNSSVTTRRVKWRLIGSQQLIVLCMAVLVGCSGPVAGPPEQPSIQPAIQIPDIAIDISDPSASAPVSVGAGVAPGEVHAGETVTLVVRAKLADGWHIYAADRESGSTVPTSLALNLPDGLEPVGDWKYPEPETSESVLGPIHVYHHEAVFAHNLRVAEGAQGNLNIQCEFGYQACNDDICHRPRKC